MTQVALYLELLKRGDEVYFDLSNYTKDYDCHNGWEVEKVFFNLRLNILKNKNNNYFIRVNKFIIRILRYIEKIVTRNEKLSYYDKVRSRLWKNII